DDWDDLYAARSDTYDPDPLAAEVDRRRRPQSRVVRLAAEFVAPGNVGEERHRQDAGGCDEEPRTEPCAFVRRHRPRSRGLVVHGRGDLLAESHVAAKVEPVDDVVEVALGLRLFGEVLLPFPLVEQLFREQVAVGVALGVEPGPRIAVPVPRPADAVTGFEQSDREA